jgi:DNA-binding transcriptional LysR family regulator
MNPKAAPITNVNLKLLQTFVLVAEHGSFHKAAGETCRSQSAVSSQIRQLEQQLGFQLFHRTTRSVRLTPDGAQLLSHTKKALEEVKLGLQRIFEGGSAPGESVTFACLPTIAMTRMPEILAIFRKRFPRCGVYVRELDAADLFESLREGEVDFALAADNRGKEFSFDPLFDDAYVALLPAKFLPRGRRSIALQELAARPLLLFNPTGKVSRTLVSALQTSNIQITTRCQFRQVQTVLSMVAAGLGAAILPRSSLPAPLPNSVGLLAIREPEVMRRICVVRFGGRPPSQSAARLIALFKEQFGYRAETPAVGGISSLPPLVAVAETGRPPRALNS